MDTQPWPHCFCLVT